jgi:hypothetical protein
VVTVFDRFAWRTSFSYWATDLSSTHDHKHLKINNRSLQVGYIVGQLLTDPAEQRFNNDRPCKIRAQRHAAMMRVTLRRRFGGGGIAAFS